MAMEKAYMAYRKRMEDPRWRSENVAHLEWFTSDTGSDRMALGGSCYRPMNREEFEARFAEDENFRKDWEAVS